MQPEAQETDSDVYFELKSISPRTNKPIAVGQAFLNLRRLLEQGRDFTSASLSIKGAKAPTAGTLTVSIFALQTLRNAIEQLLI